ncbi:MAG TPA: hypothetical protein VFI14_03280, partial [Chryseosolibacter sp.]|nr:hypothetical protein [Chryseosolibacter sp.]
AGGQSIYVIYRDRRKTAQVKVEPFDPLFLLKSARWHDATECWSKEFPLDIPGMSAAKSIVRVRLSLLPEEWQSGACDRQLKQVITRRPKGFSIIRSRREVDTGLFGFRRGHWVDRWWGGEITFEPRLDDYFNITHTKQSASLSTILRNVIGPPIQDHLTSVSKIIVGRSTTPPPKLGFDKSENIAKQYENYLGSPAHIREKTQDVIAREIKRFEDDEGNALPGLVCRVKRQEKPYLMDFEDVPGGAFFRIREVGKMIVIVVNRHHPFFEKLYLPLCGAGKGHNIGLELMIVALIKAESHLKDMKGLFTDIQIERLHEEWSRVLSTYLLASQQIQE